MNVIYEPQVYLVGKQVLLDEGIEAFLEAETPVDRKYVPWADGANCDAERLVEIAGRLCYLSYQRPRPGGNKAYLNHVLEVGHGSITEHAVWSFIITGISRSCSHELVRHRIGMSPSQLSQRYVDESVAEYVEPDAIGTDPELHRIWQEAVEFSHQAYCKLADKLHAKLLDAAYEQAKSANPLLIRTELSDWLRGVGKEQQTAWRKEARQAARSVLPNATETKLFLTFNARALRNFFELRASRHAEPEIRKVANRIYEIMLKESPHLFGDYEQRPLWDGTFELTTPNRKV